MEHSVLNVLFCLVLLISLRPLQHIIYRSLPFSQNFGSACWILAVQMVQMPNVLCRSYFQLRLRRHFVVYTAVPFVFKCALVIFCGINPNTHMAQLLIMVAFIQNFSGCALLRFVFRDVSQDTEPEQAEAQPISAQQLFQQTMGGAESIPAEIMLKLGECDVEDFDFGLDVPNMDNEVAV